VKPLLQWKSMYLPLCLEICHFQEIVLSKFRMPSFCPSPDYISNTLQDAPNLTTPCHPYKITPSVFNNLERQLAAAFLGLNIFLFFFIL
jgi:hypothetical protein